MPVDELNLIEVYNNLLALISSEQDKVEITYTDTNGNTVTEVIPTLKSLSKRIAYLNNLFDKLVESGQLIIKVNNETKVIKITSPYSTYFKNPDIINYSVGNPTVINIFDPIDAITYPQVYIPFDVKIDIDAIEIIKVIIDDVPNSDPSSFVSGLSDGIKFDELINTVNNASIKYRIVKRIINANTEVINKVGTFVVLEVQNITDSSATIKLNTISYGSGNILVGDTLVDEKGVEYKVTSVSDISNTITVEYTTGVMGLETGTVLSKLSNDYTDRTVFYIPINPFEDFVLYWRPVAYGKAPSSFVYATKYTSNNTNIIDTSGNTIPKDAIKDIRSFILGKLNNKEVTEDKPKQVRPNPPILNPDNFKVIKINTHLDNKVSSIKELVKEKNTLEKDIEAIDNKLKDNPTDKTLLTKRLELSQRLVSTTNKILGQNTQLPKPKFRVTGFFDIPDPIEVDGVGLVEPIRFVVRYKYLEKETGKQPNSEKVGKGYTPVWNEIKLKPRQKVWDEEKQEWKFADEDITNPENIPATNISIPINPGEKIEIQVKALYELGYPNKPLESDWSNSIIVSFPDELENVVITQKEIEKQIVTGAIADVKDKIQLHTVDEVITESKSYAHISDRILYDQDNNKSVKDIIDELKNKIEILTKRFSPPVIELIDDRGNVYNIQNMTQKTFIVGYYADEYIEDGDIITKTWVLRIKPQKGLVLRLVSGYYGNLNVPLPNIIPTDLDYNNLFRYDVASFLGLSNVDVQTAITNNFYFKSPQLSGQSFSQFIYTRYKTLTEQNAVFTNSDIVTISPVDANNLYGSNISGNNVPIYTDSSGYTLYMLPYDPEYDNGGVWIRDNNVFTYTGNASGGVLSEFCFHVNHPISGSVTNQSQYKNYVLPNIYGSVIQGLPLLSYYYDAIIDNTQKAYNVYSRQWYWYPNDVPASATYIDRLLLHPMRTFIPEDKYLIGKYTCGMHISINPSLSDIFVGPTRGSYKEVDTWIDIPIVIKYRLRDALGYIGGYRHGSVVNDISYYTILPIDIWYGNNDVFQFDLIFVAKYNRS